jgi:hypothetical protein
MTAHCRIGRVTHKASGLVSLPSQGPEDDLGREFFDNARAMFETAPGSLAGYALVLIYENATDVSYSIPASTIVQPSMFPAMVEHIMAAHIMKRVYVDDIPAPAP